MDLLEQRCSIYVHQVYVRRILGIIVYWVAVLQHTEDCVVTFCEWRINVQLVGVSTLYRRRRMNVPRIDYCTVGRDQVEFTHSSDVSHNLELLLETQNSRIGIPRFGYC